ncbi:hypothetical protein [Streptomyces sp. UH6]|uniref:hypothetical protein n=1 Tax=Streptomyces sp. UH6 TaxID=2748379 RepID=UPI0015D4793A|nr:hypothetical protein [Streptomyces sp. UH6]NYV72964.1 hypothetical protein [Streptomyces sp. UH6]
MDQEQRSAPTRATSSPTLADLHAQCHADYGTPEQRAARATEAGIQTALARVHGNEAGGTR